MSSLRRNTVVSVRLSADLVEEMDRFAAENQMTRSHLVMSLLVAANDNRQLLLGGYLRQREESLLRAMNKGETR